MYLYGVCGLLVTVLTREQRTDTGDVGTHGLRRTQATTALAWSSILPRRSLIADFDITNHNLHDSPDKIKSRGLRPYLCSRP